MTDKQLHITRPTNRSFEAYVAWMKQVCKGAGVEYTTPEDKARDNWLKFWAKSERKKAAA